MSVQSIRILNPWFLELDNNGRPAAGYLVWTLEAGSVDTLVDTYANEGLTTLNTNPVVLNARGECVIFTDLQYIQLVFTSPTGDLSSIIWRQDYIQAAGQNDLGNVGVSVGTINNVYVVNTVPAYASIPDGFSLVMIPDATNQDTIIGQTFAGTGINDIVFSGPYNGTTSSTFEVTIDGVSSPNTIKWRKDSGAYVTGVPLTAGKQYLTEGIYFQSSEIVGHTLNDKWTLQVRTPAYLNFCGLGADLIYKNIAGSLKVLNGGDIIAGIPAHLDRSASQSCWILINPSLPVLSDLPRVIHRREVTGDSSVTTDDAGNEVSYIGTGGHTLSLLSCADAAGFPFDFSTAGNLVTIETNGSDVIILPEAPAGVTKLSLRADIRSSIRLLSNGANWHVLADTQIPHGSIESADGDTWICPDNITTVYITASGGGGGGASNGTGGVAGDKFFRFPVTVVPGTSYAIVVGVGGTPGPSGAGSDGGVGGDVSFGALLTVTGGAGGTTGGTPAAGETSLFGRGGTLGTGANGGNANGRGAGGGGSDNASNQGGAGSDGFILLEW